MSRFDDIRSIVDRALPLDPAARRALLDSTCGDDHDLRREVESLLRASLSVPDVLETGGAAMVLEGDVASAELLNPGLRFDHYEIVALVGSGGMGHVYRARDVRLDRTVAVKVLRANAAEHLSSRRRLEREARIISQLQHPGICTLYDIGHHEGMDYLVMEYLEGSTLAEELRSSSISIERALDIGSEIAQALDYAHRAGVIHRDLKPGNVMLTASGVKLLDFGVAKPGVRPWIAGGQSHGPAVDESQLTRAGTLIGTVPYMSPEQLDGGDVDSRSDIFAFGAVVYEMLSGRRAFDGEGASLIAAIMTSNPPRLREVAPGAPEPLQQLLDACLAKDPNERIQTAHDVALQLGWTRESLGRAAQRRDGTRAVTLRIALWVSLAVLATVVAFGTGLRLRNPGVPSEVRVTRFEVPLPAGTEAMYHARISPDGSTIAFIGIDSTGARAIWIRDLRYVEPRRVPHTERATGLTWAPDGNRLAFFDDGVTLETVDLVTSTVTTLCRAGNDPLRWSAEAVWTADDRIVYDAGPLDPLFEISLSGGGPRPCTTLDPERDELGHIRPHVRDDRLTFLVLRDGAPRTLAIAELGTSHTYLELADSRGQLVAHDQVLYVRRNALMLRRIDPLAGAFIGDPVPIVNHIVSGPRQAAEFSASENGVLAYRTAGTPGVELVAYDRGGRATRTHVAPGEHRFACVASDGRIAVATRDPYGNRDIWVHQEAQLPRRLTFREGNDNVPVWSHDERHIYYLASIADRSWIMRVAASGEGVRDTLLTSEAPVLPMCVSPEGRYLVFTRIDRRVGSTWEILPINPPGEPRRLAGTGGELDARVSPDGRWLSYTAPAAGLSELFVQRFPGGESRQQLTVGGAHSPRWGRGGREILFLRGDDVLSLEVIESSTTFEVSDARRVFSVTVAGGNGNSSFSVTQDGQRFVVPVTSMAHESAPVTVVTSWQTAVPGP